MYFVSILLALAFDSAALQRISEAKRVIAANPASLQAYIDLAAALCERAIETENSSLFSDAETALQHSFQIAPSEYSARKTRVAVLLGLHRWGEAWESAKQLNHAVPDDVAVWGLLAEANLALGNYSEAQKAAQWMLDLRPGNAEALLPVAHLREVYGDLEGAIDFVNEALRRVPENEQEHRAFLMAELARLYCFNQESKRASALVAESLRLVPNGPKALQVSALLEKEAGHLNEAASLLSRRYEQTRSTAALYDCAEMLELAGRKAEASAAFRTFEKRGVSESDQPYNANRELVFYYADHADDPPRALRLAKQERAVRHDIATLEASAWALFRNGKIEDAKREIDLALSVGTRDPGVLAHARLINAP